MSASDDLSRCLDCGSEYIKVKDPERPGKDLAYVTCLACGTAVMGDTRERAIWIWNLPRQAVPESPSLVADLQVKEASPELLAPH